MENITGKVALVTGASRGIGRAVAIGLARAGCDVAVNYRERKEGAEGAVREIRQGGRRAEAIRADVSRRAEVEEMVGAVERQLGPIAILVNNAGIARVQQIEEITEEDWNEQIAVNLTSCFLVTQAALPGNARAAMGADRQCLVGGGAGGEHRGAALRGFQGRDAGAYPRVRTAAG